MFSKKRGTTIKKKSTAIKNKIYISALYILNIKTRKEITKCQTKITKQS